jgi:5-methyltetrahydrofolate--homocysteine methyltransferase
VSAQHPILSRLETGRPLLASADAEASLRSRGVTLKWPAAIGRLIREQPGVVADHYHQEVASGVDVLCAFTSDTLPRVLAQIGMSFRAAALTGCAVDLALDAADAAPRPMIVAGVLGTHSVAPTGPDRMAEELAIHATRLAAAGCELILARGFASTPSKAHLAKIALRAAIVSASATQLPTWALLEVDDNGFTLDGESAENVAFAATEAGAELLLFEVPSAESGLTLLERLRVSLPDARVGIVPSATGVSGDSIELPDVWAASAKRLLDAGARVIGGGVGTTSRHVAALANLLRSSERQSLWPRTG